jgi:hypothetical protein
VLIVTRRHIGDRIGRRDHRARSEVQHQVRLAVDAAKSVSVHRAAVALIRTWTMRRVIGVSSISSGTPSVSRDIVQKELV